MSGAALIRSRARERITWWDRILMAVAPQWGLRRVQARAATRAMARHYEAAQGGRRTSGWQRFSSDANAAAGPALTALRELSRDLLRNNGWAQTGVDTEHDRLDNTLQAAHLQVLHDVKDSLLSLRLCHDPAR